MFNHTIIFRLTSFDYTRIVTTALAQKTKSLGSVEKITSIYLFFPFFLSEIHRRLEEDEESLKKLDMDINELHKKMDKYLAVIQERADYYIHC